MTFCVAIDGPAASGKGTISRALAQKFGFAHLDTGLLYRAVGRRMLAGLRPESAAKSLTAEDLADEANLRGPEVAQAASQVAAIPAVRHALVDFQRVFAARAGGSVLDGRDIGTVICPSADVKLFVTASPEIRARRRTEELMHRGLKADYDTVLVDVLARDARDADRTIAPMIAADDAELLDTSQLSIAQAINRATEIVRAAQR
ncbi:MAG: (d)CMP kinase [Pseudomonadota bacterium]